jgi:DNA invertase Pin-like site-specific DNA recombinase
LGRVFGYARVSTDKQDTDAQRRALQAAGCVQIVEEQASGRKARPALAALLQRLEPGDVVTVWKIDRLSRNVPDFYRIAARITECGAELRSLTEAIDTAAPIGRAMLGILAVFAQLEAEHASERVRNGLRAARGRGKRLGRPRGVTPPIERDIAAKLASGAAVKTLARDYALDPSTVRRIRERQQAG